MEEERKTVGELVKESRERAGLSKNQLAELAKVSHTEISRIESGEREIPNPKTLRKISKFIDVTYTELMYASGYGLEITTLNPFLTNYYSSLKGDQIVDAILNTTAVMKNWQELVDSLKQRLEKNHLKESEIETIQNTIDDTEYQIKTAKEIINVLNSARRKENVENAKKHRKEI